MLGQVNPFQLRPYIFPSGLHTPFTVFQFIEEYFALFVGNKGQFSSFWMASPVDAKKLRQEYDAACVNTFTSIDVPQNISLSFQIVKEEDLEYYRALKASEFCGMVEEWLLNELSGVSI